MWKSICEGKKSIFSGNQSRRVGCLAWKALLNVTQQWLRSGLIPRVQIYLDSVRIHLKRVSRDQFWSSFAFLLICDFICRDSAAKHHQWTWLHWLPVCIKGRSAVLHLCYAFWATNSNMWQYRESIVCMKTPDLPGLMTKAICRGSTHYYRRAYESSRTEAIKQVWNNCSLTLHKDRCWRWKVGGKFNKLLNKPTFSFTLWLCVFLWLAGLLIDCILALYVHLLWKVTEL